MDNTLYQYTPEVLKKLQDTQKEILRKFDEVCQKHGITYWAVFGTAIGAVRHKDFIPWDDDIDLGIMLDDYDKLLKVPEEEWGEFEFISGDKDVNYHHSLFVKIYKKGTIQESQWRVDNNKPKTWPNHPKMPIWIDVFIYSHVKDVDVVRKNIKKSIFLRKLYRCCKTGRRVRKEDSIRKRVGSFARDVLFRILNLFNRPEIKVYNKFFKFVRETDKVSHEYVTTFTCLEPEEMTALLCKESEMFPTIRVPFGEATIPLQKNNHEILTTLYGDYMALPPEDKRFNHPPAILDFGDGKGNVINQDVQGILGS